MADEKKPIDPEVREVMEDQKRLARGTGRESAERERTLKRLSAKLLAAIRARDQRAFARLLRDAGVSEGSSEWTRAWRLFWSAGD